MTTSSRIKSQFHYLFIVVVVVVFCIFVISFSSNVPKGESQTVTFGQECTNCEPQQTFTIANRLKESEIIWKRSVERRMTAFQSVNLKNGLDFSKYQMLWDFFYPTFDCPYTKERIGRVGDGGKWICGFSELINKPDCVVYSFGVKDDTSFENEVLERTRNCKVVMFDPTISKEGPPITKTYPDRSKFKAKGISGTEAADMSTLKKFMDEDGLKSLDILKMDVEGAEWASVEQILKDFPDTLPFSQLQIEFHLHAIQPDEWPKHLMTFWQKLEARGLRPYFSEPNLLNEGINRFIFWETCFINIKSEQFRLQQ